MYVKYASPFFPQIFTNLEYTLDATARMWKVDMSGQKRVFGNPIL